jgi:hypothetical protein
VVVDAVWIEPVSTTKFPDNRENTGNFRDFAGKRPWQGINCANYFRWLQLNSLRNGTGNFASITGKFAS